MQARPLQVALLLTILENHFTKKRISNRFSHCSYNDHSLQLITHIITSLAEKSFEAGALPNMN